MEKNSSLLSRLIILVVWLKPVEWLKIVCAFVNIFFSWYFFCSVNGKIKQWRHFNQVIPNSSISHVWDDLTIVYAIINAYCSTATLNVHGDEDIAVQMLEQLKKDNILEKHLSELDKQTLFRWNKYDGIFCLFPSLTPNDIKNITFGSIHLSLLLK